MFWLVLFTLLAPEAAGEPPATPRGYVVIVHAAHQGETIPRADLAAVFLGRATHWRDRTAIESVDQSLSSGVREAFCRDVLNLEPRALLQYWQSQIQRGTGRRPPSVKDGDAQVVEWVAGRPGRIGYVSSDAVLDGGVKVLRVLEPGGATSEGRAP